MLTDRLVLLVPAVLLAALGGLFLRSRPKAAILLWLCVVCLVPVWLGATVSVYFTPAILSAAIVLVLLLPLHNVRYGWGDLFVLFFVLASLLPVITGGSTRTTVFVVLAQWWLPFLLGRLAPLRSGLDWIYGCIAVLFTLVAILAILEFVLKHNLFVALSSSNELYMQLSKLQVRGGLIRAEGAFGHSIALGSSIALAIPFTLAAPFRLGIRAAMTGVMLCGTVVTFSRTAMICAGLSVILSVMFLRDGISRRVRVAVVAAVATLAVVLVPLVSSTFAAAGSEATNSAEYRGNLLSLLPDVSLSGFTAVARVSPAGELYFGRFHSIDSALILTGLTYGWLTLVIAIGLLASATVLVVIRRGSPATIAVVAQIPALATVALITQYATFVWFVAGVAVYSQTIQSVTNEGYRDPEGGDWNPKDNKGEVSPVT